jgi:hypothetical protein
MPGPVKSSFRRNVNSGKGASNNRTPAKQRPQTTAGTDERPLTAFTSATTEFTATADTTGTLGALDQQEHIKGMVHRSTRDIWNIRRPQQQQGHQNPEATGTPAIAETTSKYANQKALNVVFR